MILATYRSNSVHTVVVEECLGILRLTDPQDKEVVELDESQESALLALLLQRASAAGVGQTGKDLLRRSARAEIETVLSERFVTSNEQRLARALTHILDSLI